MARDIGIWRARGARPATRRRKAQARATVTATAGRTSKHQASKPRHQHQRPVTGNTERAVTRTRRSAPSLGAIETKNGWRPAVYKKDARQAREAS
jgi:hypothetical protein